MRLNWELIWTATHNLMFVMCFWLTSVQTNPDGGPPAPAGLGQAGGDVRHPVWRHAHHHEEEEGAFEKGDLTFLYFHLINSFHFEMRICT